MSVKRLVLWALLTAAVLPLPEACSAERRPNVVLIMADDLGYETIGANGGTSYKTPALDRLAAEGIRFEHCYVQPLCTPTRVQLMTGAYNVRNYVQFGLLDRSAKTFGHLFRDAGYATGIAGKWQLGREKDSPQHFGFQESCLWQHTRRPPRYANPGLEFNGVEKNYSHGEYGPDLVNEFALDFITRHKAEPFFLYYPLILTHAPYQPTPDSKDWDPAAVGENVNKKAEHFGDMVEYMDKLLGKLFARLDELKLRENTLVVFLGDNGTGKGTPSKVGDSTVIGGKGMTTAAGMHVPLMVRWPRAGKSGAVSRELIDSTDLLPTICEAAGISPPAEMKLDGHSFLPQIRGEKGKPREWIYSWYSPRQNKDQTTREFAFNHKFKLYRSGKFFDLRRDPEEKSPLDVEKLQGEAAEVANQLRLVLESFRDARPKELDRRFQASENDPGES